MLLVLAGMLGVVMVVVPSLGADAQLMDSLTEVADFVTSFPSGRELSYFSRPCC
jgi:hypothetical protein